MAIHVSRASSATVSFATPQEVVINRSDDSITAWIVDANGVGITSTLFNSKQSLDVRPNTGYSTGSSTTPAINNVSSTILASNVSRRNAYVFNQSGSTVFLKLGTTAVLNEGIRLVNNSMYEINASNLWTGSITAIKSGAASVNLDVFEGT